MQFVKYTKNFAIDACIVVRSAVGRMIREAGLDMDKTGSGHTQDVACYQSFNRHRNILPLYDLQPVIGANVHIAPNATIIGQVLIGKDSYFGFGSVAQGESNPIRVGQNTKIGQNTVLDTTFWGPQQAFPLSLNIGSNVNIQHSCTVRSSIIDDNVHIGFRSVILEGSQLERGCIITPNSTVRAGTRIPQNTMWGGNPVQFIKNLQPVDKRVQEAPQPKIIVIQNY